MSRPAAVTLDAMGTLVSIAPPGPRLQRSLARRLGREVDLARCEGAMRAEMRHYRAHCTAARDASSLAALRLECASLLADALAIDVSGADLLPSLTDSIAFLAYDDARPALERLAAAGIKLAVVANWDVSLPDVLARLGLAEPFEVIVTAAAVGAAKPDSRPFQAALERLGTRAAQCVHVGDDPVTDIAGARAAGLSAVLLDRSGRAPDSIAGLSELDARLELAA
ncbi:MAG: putative hydrolase of the superfamily [Gaiellales bacterium]|nr:putative hydrolase of the superfamily [Gaiellales bacterium]